MSTERSVPGGWDGESRWVLQQLAACAVSSMHKRLRKWNAGEGVMEGEQEEGESRQNVRECKIKISALKDFLGFQSLYIFCR